jgi:hypothetical protein
MRAFIRLGERKWGIPSWVTKVGRVSMLGNPPSLHHRPAEQRQTLRPRNNH